MELSHQEQATRVVVKYPNYGTWLKQGAYGGIIAGVTFALFEMIFAALTANNFFGPLRMIGAVALGKQALTPAVPLFDAALVGGLVHMVYSIAASVILAYLIAIINPLHSNAATIIITATIYGLLMWLVNFYLIAPAAGWNWFPEVANQLWQGFVAHTFFYGTVLGLYLSGVKNKLW